MAIRVVVVGAAGFGRETLDTLEASNAAGIAERFEIAGVLDDSPSVENLERLRRRGVPYLGTVAAHLSGSDDSHFLIGIGHCAVRRQLADLFAGAGRQAAVAIHPAATLGSQCVLGPGTVVCAGAQVSTNVRTGLHVHINPNATIGHDTILDDFVSINPAAVISGDVHIRAESLVGAAATVLQGLTVGSRVTLGAGTVVTKDTPGDVVVTGVPGRWAA